MVSGISGPLFSQTKISGIINKYGRVTGVGTDYVIVDDATQFAQFLPGDTVLLIQMKGVRIYSVETASYGTPNYSYGPAGKHEFLTILTVEPGTKKIIFRNNIVNSTFNPEGEVQIIKVPYYNFAQVDGTLTCQPWDSVTKTGGVLSVIIGRTLSLNANIDVSGKGFKGGSPSQGLGLCTAIDVTKLDRFAYPAGTDSSGYKGESPVIIGGYLGPLYPKIHPQYGKGKGANLTGGGGGNGKFSGGGGGANYGSGGKGGREMNTCSTPVDGGSGGKIIKGTELDPGMFLGSGGGGSTYLTGGTSTAGGNGGGMVILVCDTLKGNVKSILADGGSVTTSASGNAGAGGGGGGGTIALYLQSYYTSLLTVSAKGGKGGDNTGQAFGEGGGGGGGFINTSNATTANVTKTVTGGAVGLRFGASSGASGTAGEIRTNYVPILNGFLFNSIRSSVTGNQVDSICSDVIPKSIYGTLPIGGSGSYTYKWQKSYDLSGPDIDIAGSNIKDYIPTQKETDTVWFRRIVLDDGTSLTDTSKWVEIRVQTAIEGNIVGKDTIICYNQIPVALIPLNDGPSKGNSIYQYQWIQNNTNTDWTSSTDAEGAATISTYAPPALTDTTYYKRIVTSGRCVDSSATVTVTVLPLITGNIMDRPDSVICEGTLFNTLSTSDAGGGAGTGTYKYLWQDSIASGSWTSAPNVRDGTSYTVDTSFFTVIEKRYFRRVVFSGPDSVCISRSLPIEMTRYHYIEDNTISKDTTICSGSVPPAFTGSTPRKGSETFTYIWQDSSKVETWKERGTLISPFAPAALTDTTWYRRIVNSSKCSDTSMVLVINVHKPITNNDVSLISGPGPDTTICSGAVPHKLKGALPDGGTDLPGDYACLWYYSTDNFNTSNNAVAAGGTFPDYQPGALTDTTWFRRKVISGKCEKYSNEIRIIVLPPVTNNVITSTQIKVCYDTEPLAITGTALTGGAGGTPTWLWQQSTDGVTWITADGGSSNQQNYSPPKLKNPTKYRRIILSGPYDCCQDTSNVLDIGIYDLPTGTITSVNDTICNGSTVQLKIHLTGASPWDVVYNENTTPVNAPGITTAGYIINRVPAATAASSTFNYSFVSITDKNNCVATATLMTGSRKATVYRIPVAFAGDDAEICGPEYKLKAVPTDGTGTWTWESSAPVLSPYPVAYNDTVKIDKSAITDASDTYEFYWEEKNWQCESKDAVKITFINPVDQACAGIDTTIYSFDFLIQVNATPLKAWETGLWSVVEGTGDFDDASASSTNVRNLAPGTNIFKWYIENGQCNAEDELLVDIKKLEIPEGFTPNNDAFNDTFVIRGLDLRKNPDDTPAYQLAELKIISGSGTQVFETSNIDGNEWKEWDGKDSNGTNLPEGTYYYLLKLTSIEVPGTPFKQSGFVVLKRY